MPRVSVVMSAYNHEKYVAEAIQSILEQTYQDFEIVITDNGSTDGTNKAIREFKDTRIKLLTLPNNQGACAGLNNSIKNASGELIALISSDDVFLPDKLKKQVEFLDENPDKVAVLTYAEFIDDNSNYLTDEQHHYKGIFRQPNRTRLEWLRLFFLHGNCLCHPSALIRKRCYDHIGLYDERFAQLPDFDFWIRLCMKYELYVMPENLVKFRIHQNQASANNLGNSSRLNLEEIQILKNNYLTPEISQDLLNIFPVTASINEFGITKKVNEIEKELAPFLLAMIAFQVNRPAQSYFCFDILYQMCANKEVVQKLKEQYSFDFSNLTELAREQDIFGIVAIDRVKSQLHETEALLQQSQSQLYQSQALLEQSYSQMHHTQQELEQSKSQLHQTQGELHQTQVEFKRSQSQLHQTQTELEHSQTQLHQTQTELEHSQTQLYQTQTELENSQTQLHQTQTELENSQTQLHQTQTELKRAQSQLDQTQEELAQSHSQVYQSQRELEQSQTQLHQTEALLEQSQTQLHQKQEEWNRLQTQQHQIQEKLEQSQTQQHQIEEKLQQFQIQLHQTEEQLQQSKIQLHQTEEQLQQSEIQLHQTQGELELSQFQQALGSDKDGQEQMQYRLLVWEACRAYHNNALTKMQECLQQSLKYTPFSGTQTVNDWLESLAKFSSEKGCEFDTYSLTNSEEWKQLMRRAVGVKPILGRSRFVGQA